MSHAMNLPCLYFPQLLDLPCQGLPAWGARREKQILNVFICRITAVLWLVSFLTTESLGRHAQSFGFLPLPLASLQNDIWEQNLQDLTGVGGWEQMQTKVFWTLCCCRRLPGLLPAQVTMAEELAHLPFGFPDDIHFQNPQVWHLILVVKFLHKDAPFYDSRPLLVHQPSALPLQNPLYPSETWARTTNSGESIQPLPSLMIHYDFWALLIDAYSP